MSLVELAIKKMQSAAKPRHESGEHAVSTKPVTYGVVGQVVVDEGAAEPAMAPAYRTDKFVRIDREALRVQGLMPPEQQERVLADQYRQIKRPLISRAIGRGASQLPRGQLIMMASAMPGEGKTFTAINLALSMALEKDVSVLLVDSDVAKPHISRTFGVEGEPGLLDVLRKDSVDVESMVLTTDVPGFNILPAGQRSDTATELLASARMEEIMNHLIQRDPARIVLVDSPPLLLTSESRVLAQAVGQVVLVVRAGFTPQQAVLDAIEYLGENKHIGLILNQSLNAPVSGYYYGYGDSL